MPHTSIYFYCSILTFYISVDFKSSSNFIFTFLRVGSLNHNRIFFRIPIEIFHSQCALVVACVVSLLRNNTQMIRFQMI
ncbi:unnamed protein product [Meloidogyne enterolobii]|uniref:Uncharacterized protein n=1 Tax=Meloidogyne enterolobii TaxID=390850 RepID=A0ACB1AEY9_MELEN